MICILSQAFLEPTTEAVIDWLEAWKLPFVRVNGEDIVSCDGPHYSISNRGVTGALKIDGVSVDPSAVKVVWFRRWATNSDNRNSNSVTKLLAQDNPHESRYNIISFFSHLRSEVQTVSQFFFSTLVSATWLGHPSNSSLNKLSVLGKAAEIGLDIPDTLVTTGTGERQRFAEKHGEVITKPLSEILMCVFGQRLMTTYTSVVSGDHLCGGDPGSACFPLCSKRNSRRGTRSAHSTLTGSAIAWRCFPSALPTLRSISDSTPTRIQLGRCHFSFRSALRACFGC
jgi:hypothetical protein